MKFIAIAAIMLGVSNAAADKFVLCSKDSVDCTTSDRLDSQDAACVERRVVYVYNTRSPKYLNALEKDPELKADTTVYRCVTVSKKDDLLELSGIEDEATTVQSEYKYLPTEKELNSGAGFLAVSTTAVLIGSIIF